MREMYGSICTAPVQPNKKKGECVICFSNSDLFTWMLQVHDQTKFEDTRATMHWRNSFVQKSKTANKKKKIPITHYAYRSTDILSF